jgi:hypothetical protein
MRNPIPATRRTAASALIGVIVCSLTNAQSTWTEMAHPSSPHTFMYDSGASIPQLLANPTATVELPLLVILLEFSDVQHHDAVHHATYFWDDFVFGTGGGEWTSTQPSLKQILEANSNGRFSISRAQETYGIHNDGIVGWVQAQCNPTSYSGGYCVGGTEDNKQCDPAVPGACEAGGGHCEGCDTWEYYRWKDHKKRTEALRRADPYIDFSQFDVRDNGWDDGADSIVTDNELAVLIIHAKEACIDMHGHGDWGGGADCTIGAVRETDPTTISTDGITLYVQPSTIPEGGTTQAATHEFYHHVFGLDEQYNGSWPSCNPHVLTMDGHICYPCARDKNPPITPCNDECADAVCLEDAGLWGGYLSAEGSTEGATGYDMTPPCGTNDSADVWFAYTPLNSGNVTVTISSSTMIPTLSIFTACQGGVGISCVVGSPSASDTLYLTGGVTYWIRVSGDNGATGSYSIRINGLEGTCSNSHDSKWYPEEPEHQSVMDNHQQLRMPYASPWTRMHLGFTKPLVAADDGTYTLYRAEPIRSITQQQVEPEMLIVNDWLSGLGDKRYFILENRAPESFWTPGTTVEEGLAIWGIHEYPLPGDSKLQFKRTVRLIRPKLWSEDTAVLWDGSDPDYYDLTYQDTTVDAPRNTDWPDGQPSYIEITNISAAGPVMTVDIRLPGLFADREHQGTEVGTPDYPFRTIGSAADLLEQLGKDWTIRTKPGTYPENGLVIDTPCTIKPWGSGTVYIGQ